MSTSADSLTGTASLLRELRDRDTETGLLMPNRLYQALLAEIARSARYSNPLSCVRLQVHGIGTADRETRLRLASRLADSMRATDYAGIWDDDEFLLVLPETDEPGARRFTGKVEQELTELASGLNMPDAGEGFITTKMTNWRTGDDAGAILGRLETRTRA